ncbi:MAG: acyltransferase [Micrococcales bacterium]|nr:acyltransferase [Micrococcales bacterium]
MTATGAGALPRTQARLAYLDVARGLCILAVVLVHVGFFHVFPLAGDPTGRPALKLWVVFNSAVLAEVRMPLLLLVSGWLASSKVRAGLGSGKTRWAIFANIHLLVVWTILYAIIERLTAPGPAQVATSTAETVPAALLEIVNPAFGPLWFVHLLAISLVVLSLGRRLPPALVIGALLAIGWVTLWYTGERAGIPRAVFFAVGVYLGPKVPAMVSSRPALIGAGAATLGFGVLAAVLPPLPRYPVEVAACVPLSILVLAVAAWATRARRLSVLTRPLAWVGRRTLGVYVLHWPLVGILTVWAANRAGDFGFLRRSQMMDVTYPLVVTLIIAATCVVAESALRRVGFGILFEPPTRLRRLVDPAARQQPAQPQAAVMTALATRPRA